MFKLPVFELDAIASAARRLVFRKLLASGLQLLFSSVAACNLI